MLRVEFFGKEIREADGMSVGFPAVVAGLSSSGLVGRFRLHIEGGEDAVDQAVHDGSNTGLNGRDGYLPKLRTAIGDAAGLACERRDP